MRGMPGLDAIRATWDSPEGWQAAGDEWSGPWGGTESLWWSTLLPRIHTFLPAATILELGPGQGRCSQYLKDHCERLIGVDVAAHAVETCRERFAGAEHLEFHVGDGRSLPMVDDGAVDLCFSFDSLVHAEADVVDAYANELARVLADDGVAFLHISNLGEYGRRIALADRVPVRLRRRLTIHGLLPSTFAWRARSATAAGFAASCERAGLACTALELIAWQHGRHLIDALALVTRRGSRWDRPRVVVRNRGFVSGEARVAERIARIYGGQS